LTHQVATAFRWALIDQPALKKELEEEKEKWEFIKT
jgi:hypothetical protein